MGKQTLEQCTKACVDLARKLALKDEDFLEELEEQVEEEVEIELKGDHLVEAADSSDRLKFNLISEIFK